MIDYAAYEVQLAVATRLIGEGTARSDGVYFVPCPGCGGSRFHLRPFRPEFASKFGCWTCGLWNDKGFCDAWDLLAHFFPNESRVQHRQRIEQILAGQPQSGQGQRQPSYGNRPPGPGKNGEHTDPHQSAVAAWERLVAVFKEEETNIAFAIQIAKQFHEACQRTGASLDKLVHHADGWWEFLCRQSQARLDECPDHSCQDCRSARRIIDQARFRERLSDTESIARCMPLILHVVAYLQSFETLDWETFWRGVQRAIASCYEAEIAPHYLAAVAGMEAEHWGLVGSSFVLCEDPHCPSVYCRPVVET
jgi:hypothetical protein